MEEICFLVQGSAEEPYKVTFRKKANNLSAYCTSSWGANMKISIKAKSSSGDPYTVDFLIEKNKLSVFCDCQAGKFGQLCKHKTELIAGDQSRLFDESEVSKLKELETLIPQAPELKNIAAQIAESEKIIRREQSKVTKVKKEFATKLKEGIEIEKS
jgi:uncharacterized Zn finger protein